MSVASAYERLHRQLSGQVKRDEPLARHTTYRIGGPAALLIECDSLTDLGTTLDLLAEEEVAYTVLGKGSNVLASDEGYEGAIITLGRDFRRHSFDDAHMTCGGGVSLAVLVQEAFRRGLTGLEFAVGIPGTVAGALAMNAGTRDRWIGEVVEKVMLYRPGTGLIGVGGAEISWGYRRTGLSEVGVIVECVLRLEPGDTDQIRRVMEAALRRRKRSQPLGVPNAGSVFVNPEGDSAGRLIEACGLKGYRIGGAEVSQVHANFIVNSGGASAHDVLALARHIKDRVKETHGIELRPEIRFVGAFDGA